jgi:MFS family permease
MLDTRGRRTVLVLGLSFFSLTTILLLFSNNLYLLLALRFIQGIGLSAYSTALATVLSDIVPNERLSEGVGYFGISGTIAMALGPSTGLYLYHHFNQNITIIVSCGIALSSIIFALLINYEAKRMKNNTTESGEKAGQYKTKDRSGFIEKTSIRPCIVMFFTVTAISAVFSFMPLFGKERNIENIGLFFTIYAAAMILARIFVGKVADRYGFYKAYLPSIILTFLLFITLTYSFTLPSVLLAAVFYGVGYGTVQPIMNAIIIKLSPPERRGAANATYYATLDMSFCLGSVLWGAISEFGGFTTVFLTCAGFIIISVILYYLFLHRTIIQHNETISTELE